MRLWTDLALDPIFTAIRESLDDGQELFLVGGAVRDLLLEHPINDLDFVFAENPVGLARRIAKKLDAGFFVLDDERHTSRVIYKMPDDEPFLLDFVQFTGKSLNEDLKNRDFTINAMALSTRDPESLIDPCGGWGDLKAGVIHLCSKQALVDDPVRMLRAVRQAHQFGFTYGPGLDRAMKAAARKLDQTTPERRRDEFFRILEGPEPAEALKDCYRFGIMEKMIPKLMKQAEIPASPPHQFPLLDHTFKVVENYQRLLDALTSIEEPAVEDPWWLVDAVGAMRSFSDDIQAYFANEITPGRSVRELALLGALLHDVAKPETLSVDENGRNHYYGHDKRGSEMVMGIARSMRLSNAEADWLGTMVRYHMRLLPMINAEGGPTRKAIYRFFQSTGEVGAAIAILSLADTLGTYGPTMDKSLWEKSLVVVQAVMQAWWREKGKIVSPSLLLDGNDLQKEFHLQPGAVIGKLLAALKEAQASGEVLDKEQARQFIQKQLAG